MSKRVLNNCTSGRHNVARLTSDVGLAGSTPTGQHGPGWSTSTGQRGPGWSTSTGQSGLGGSTSTGQPGLIGSTSTGQPGLDWQTGKSLPESLNHILTNGIGSDVTFVVGVKRIKIPAHKLILTSRSPVFFAMFNGPLAETEDVKITDITVEAFLPFLTYLYTDDVTLTVRTVVAVMSVARKYCVDVLVSVCENFLLTNFSPENACFLLEQAHTYTEDKLMAVCLSAIGTYSQEILTSNSFADLCPSCLTSITESDELDVDEGHVYKAVKKWAETKCDEGKLERTGCNKRGVLGNILYTIRFPIMSQDFFLDQVCKDEILTNDEIVDILMYIRNNNKTPSTGFNTKGRNHHGRYRYGTGRSPVCKNVRR